ncbi:4952_t:CDS:2 [Paraglomus occultum]|uniref:4952_t:CDS:1 n=1 Tax=Paraglomus occultum TaxID=144539 RepID=A0A9N9B3V7_9GLOM|nr:4952_t:CDS:2 [Paraglomus occultum]
MSANYLNNFFAKSSAVAYHKQHASTWSKAFTVDFRGPDDYVKELDRPLNQMASSGNTTTYFNCVTIVQSSGYGKTRTILQLAHWRPLIYICFRKDDSSEYPAAHSSKIGIHGQESEHANAFVPDWTVQYGGWGEIVISKSYYDTPETDSASGINNRFILLHGLNPLSSVKQRGNFFQSFLRTSNDPTRICKENEQEFLFRMTPCEYADHNKKKIISFRTDVAKKPRKNRNKKRENLMTKNQATYREAIIILMAS